MFVPSHQVASPPPKHQGSVLGRIVTGDSRLGQLLYWIAFCNANARLLASVQAELAELRTQHRDYLAELHHVSEFKPYRPNSKSTCAKFQNDEPLFALKVGEYCKAFPHLIVFADEDGYVTGTCTQEQLLTALLVTELTKLVNLRKRQTLTKEKCLHGMPEQWCSLCETNEKIDSVPYSPPSDFIANQLKSRKEKGASDCRVSSPEELDVFFDNLTRKVVQHVVVRQRKETHTEPHTAEEQAWLMEWYAAEEWCAAVKSAHQKPIEVPFGPLTKAIAESGRPTFRDLFGKLLESTRKEAANLRLTAPRQRLEEYAARHKNGESVTVRHLPNWCSTCKQYMTWSHDGPTGIPCNVPVLSLSFAQWNIEQVKNVIAKWQGVLDSTPARTNRVSEYNAERQLTCATRRYVIVCHMFRKGKISASAVEQAKEYLKGLLRAEQKDDHPIVKEELTFVRKQDMNLATESCL